MRNLQVFVALPLMALLVGCGAQSGSSSGNTTPVLRSIQVSPAAPAIAAGLGQQLKATGSYSDGSIKDLTNSATWSSSSSTIATVSSTGMVMTKTQGSVTVSATVSAITGSASLTVTAPNLVSLATSPSIISIAPGTATQFIATGTFTDGSTQNVTASVNWSSSNGTVATIGLNGVAGLAKADGPGSCTITASSGTISSTSTLTVTNASLTSIAVTPSTISVPLDQLQQFTATGTFSDGTSQNITNTVNWSSSNTAVATITVSGLLTAKNLTQPTVPNVSPVTVTAASGSVSGTATVAIDASDLLSLAITPANPTIAQYTSQQFSAIGTFNDGSTRNLTSQVTWASTNTSAGTVTSFGLAHGLPPGQASTTISASIASISASTVLNVSNATVVSISVTPTAQTIPSNATLAYTATGSFSDSSSQNITRDVAWQSGNTSVAIIGTGGLATAKSLGTTNISATLTGVTGSTSLAVSSTTLTSITISPATVVLAPASTQQYMAVGHYADGSSMAITNAVTWSSSASNVASVNNSGLVTGQSPGTASIAAQQGSVAGFASLLIDSSQLAAIVVSPASAQVAEQTGMQFTAVGTFADGSPSQDLTSSVLWSSSAPSVATVSNSAGTKGFVSSMTPGTTTISATFAGKAGAASLTVSNATLDAITISPTSTSIALGGTVQFNALGTFSDNTTQYLTNQVTWTSSDIKVATITSYGLASSVATGTVSIGASMNGVNANPPAVLTVH